jgi:hypothetical protein
MKLLLLIGLLMCLFGCITINFNQIPQTADDKAGTTREQNSGNDKNDNCDEQIRSAARAASHAGSMKGESTVVIQQPQAEEDNCLEDETELPRKHWNTNVPARRERSHRRPPIAAVGPEGASWAAGQTQSRVIVI